MHPVLGGALGVAAFLLFLIGGGAVLDANQQDRLRAGPVVKVLVDGGHGSGVHIGGGLVITAAHVTDEEKTFRVKSDKGVTTPAELLWQNTTYDVALLRTKATLATAPYVCKGIRVGEKLEAIGHPSMLENIHTWGTASGLDGRNSIIDISIAPGMSGGPVFDTSGRVRGIMVAMLAVSMGFSAAPTGLSQIVPMSVICPLLGRA